jgi:hypothetical protein
VDVAVPLVTIRSGTAQSLDAAKDVFETGHVTSLICLVIRMDRSLAEVLQTKTLERLTFR